MNRKRHPPARQLVRHILLTLASLVMLYPLLWMIG